MPVIIMLNFHLKHVYKMINIIKKQLHLSDNRTLASRTMIKFRPKTFFLGNMFGSSKKCLHTLCDASSPKALNAKCSGGSEEAQGLQ